MPTLNDFFLNASAQVVGIDLLEISHPSWPIAHRVLRNKGARNNVITVKLETGVMAEFKYVPMSVDTGDFGPNLDQSIKVTLGDLGTIIPDQLDLIDDDESDDIKPTVIYRRYRSDDLTKPLIGPVILQVSTFANNWQGCMFEAKARALNIVTTGEVFNIDEIPLLRSLL